MTAIALTAALALGDIYLQSLVPTSGTGADALLDGKADTSWKPEGSPEGEGVLFRFEEPVGVKTVEVVPCAGDKSSITAVYDGSYSSSVGAGKMSAPFNFRSLFLKVQSGKGCIADVNFTAPGGTVRPPRKAHGKVTVSSVLTPADAYHPGYLFDGRLDFGWVEGSKGTGEKEWLEVKLDAPVTVTAVEIWNGYQRSSDHFKKNCRPKKVTLTVDGAEAIPLELKDAEGAQKLALPKPTKGSAFKLAIDSVVKGTKYTDMVISELRLHDETGPLQVATDDVTERTKALKDELAGKPIGALLDKQLTALCSEGNGFSQSVKLRSNHTFAIYEQSSEYEMYGKDTVEVVDGAWIVKSPTSIELFGRRQRVVTDPNPYSGGKKESVRITGGTVTVSFVKSMKKEDYDALFTKWMKTPAARHLECAKAAEQGDAIVFEGTALTGMVAAK